MRQFVSGTLALLFLVGFGCAGKGKSTYNTVQQIDSIGVAWLESDGTLVMQLRAEDRGKALGDALLRYKPEDPAYHQMLAHIGNLKPGETKPVPPWPQGEPNQSP